MSEQQEKPRKPSTTSKLTIPILWIEWCLEWIAYWASHLAIFKVLEYAGRLTVLIAVILWFLETPERNQEKIRTAWSVVNTKGGGRLDALNFLSANKVDLRGLNGEYGYFGGIDLSGKNLQWADLSNANFEGANLKGTNLEGAELDGANFRNTDLTNANLRNTFMGPTPAPLFENARINAADFRGIKFSDNYLFDWAVSIASAKNWRTAMFDKNIIKTIELIAPKEGKISDVANK